MAMDSRTWLPGSQFSSRIKDLFLNPHGDRHLGFTDGHFYRLWEDGTMQEMSAGLTFLLRPTDAGRFVQRALAWIIDHPKSERAPRLADEISSGVKELTRILSSTSR
jgi:hypothetical protein